MTTSTRQAAGEVGPLRALMPALQTKTYFNYGGQGPLPTPSLEAMVECWGQIQTLGPFSEAVWPLLNRTTSQLRLQLSELFGAGPHRIAFTENVTSGCVLPLWGLPWRAGDELLLGDAEHPGVVAACRELARREHLSLASLPVARWRGGQEDCEAGVLEALERSLSPRTRLVVLSHLLWNTGQVMPIARVAERLRQHPAQPWLLVDAAQSLGSLAVAEAARAADIYAGTGHKWCCGPEGLGAVLLSERLLGEARPTLIGWRSLADESTGGGRFHGDARRFEVATSCTPLFAGLARSLALLEDEGSTEERLARIRATSGRLWQGLRALPQVHTLLDVVPPAGLVSFTMAGLEPGQVVRRLGEQGIWLRALADPSCLRACTHVTTTEEEVDRLLSALAALDVDG